MRVPVNIDSRRAAVYISSVSGPILTVKRIGENNEATGSIISPLRRLLVRSPYIQLGRRKESVMVSVRGALSSYSLYIFRENFIQI